MANLIPMPKNYEEIGGFLKKKTVKIPQFDDERLTKAAEKLPVGRCGAKMTFEIGTSGEGYELEVTETEIFVKADGAQGAFYAIQTLRQLFAASQVPCVRIKDFPDFKYRGFYHDITRGKVPTVETLKKLIDEMAYYKINELELYVEHTFEFKEYMDSVERTGALTAAEVSELDDYCYENFIEFVPSLASFGHLGELLEKDRYKHLRTIASESCPEKNFWRRRGNHHTIDPTQDESFELITSLFDQYLPLFKHTDRFNICCDETFDLDNGKYKDNDPPRLYINFVCKLINYLKSKGKTAMMWGDILLQHPEVIQELPQDVQLLNWWYWKVDESFRERFEIFKNSNRPHIVCPGTLTWSRFCENPEIAAHNISKMSELGYEYGAVGVLNTNWGDFGNPCSLELAMYGMIIGAERAWSVKTEIDGDFEARADAILYKREGTLAYEKRLSELHDGVDYNEITDFLSGDHSVDEFKEKITLDACTNSFEGANKILAELTADKPEGDEFRTEMIIAAKAIVLMAKFCMKVYGKSAETNVETETWIAEYAKKWREKNKESELCLIEQMFRDMENYKN